MNQSQIFGGREDASKKFTTSFCISKKFFVELGLVDFFFPLKKIFNGGSDRCIGLLEKIKTISFFSAFNLKTSGVQKFS